MTERRQQPPYPLRMPDDLRDRIAEVAKTNGRSMNAEIVARLDQSLRLPSMVDDLAEAYKAVDAGHDQKDALLEKMSKLYEAQKIVSDQQQHIIDQLVKAQGVHLMVAAKADYPDPKKAFEDAVNGPPSDDSAVRAEQERRGLATAADRTALIKGLTSSAPPPKREESPAVAKLRDLANKKTRLKR